MTMCYGGCNCMRCSGEKEEPATKAAKRYVQHISGQGRKWEVTYDFDAYCWQVKDVDYYKDSLFVPKSEYRLCDPPEQWEDVTAKCKPTNDKWPNNYGHAVALCDDELRVLWEPTFHAKDYRLRKVCDCDPMPSVAFIVERKVQ